MQTAKRNILNAERIVCYANKLIATAIRFILFAFRIISFAFRFIQSAERNIASAFRFMPSANRIIATAKMMMEKRASYNSRSCCTTLPKNKLFKIIIKTNLFRSDFKEVVFLVVT